MRVLSRDAIGQIRFLECTQRIVPIVGFCYTKANQNSYHAKGSSRKKATLRLSVAYFESYIRRSRAFSNCLLPSFYSSQRKGAHCPPSERLKAKFANSLVCGMVLTCVALQFHPRLLNRAYPRFPYVFFFSLFSPRNSFLFPKSLLVSLSPLSVSLVLDDCRTGYFYLLLKSQF